MASRAEDIELLSRYLQLTLLLGLNRTLMEVGDGSLNLEPLLAGLCERAQLRQAAVYRLNAEERLLHLVAASGDASAARHESPALDGPDLVAWVARNPQSRCCGMAPDASGPGLPRVQPWEYAVPLQLGSKVLGVLYVASEQREGLRAVTAKLVDQVAEQLALGLERQELRQTLHVAQEERARLQAQVFQMQKTEALGRLAGGIAHDFNNLLSIILGFASLLRWRLAQDDPLQEQIQAITQSAERAADLAGQLLGLARQGSASGEAVCVEEVVGSVRRMVAETFDRRIRVEWQEAPGHAWVQADLTGLEQAVLNLCLNARDAMPEGGTLRLVTATQQLGSPEAPGPARCSPGTYVSIAVSDTGLGIEPEVLPRLFEPFFTTKPQAGGTGLGLAMVQAFVTQQGGFVRVESEPGRGSTFTLFLPAVAPPAARRGPEPGLGLERGTGTVLVVDDEPLVLAFVAEGLKRLGYVVVTAEDGERALATYAAHAAVIDYLIVDMVLPDRDGLEVCQRLREINPRARILMSSGYRAARVERRAREAGACDFLAKPFTLETLAQALRRLALA